MSNKIFFPIFFLFLMSISVVASTNIKVYLIIPSLYPDGICSESESCLLNYLDCGTCISGISVTSVTTNSAIINWITNVDANSTVYYSNASDNLSLEVYDNSLSISHSINLSGLNSSTLYYYKISSCIAVGICTNSSQYNFTTLSSTSSIPTITLGTGSGISKKCELNVTPANITFNANVKSAQLTVGNMGKNNMLVEINKWEIPTLFGKKDIFKVDNSSFYLNGSGYKVVTISLNNTIGIVENTTTILSVVSTSCNLNIPITIYSLVQTFYDVKILTEHLMYSPREVVNYTVQLINKGDLPDRDTLLKVYVIDSNGVKTYISQEIMFEINAGLTELKRMYPLGGNAHVGRYVLGVEYLTEEQGLLRSETSFLVMPLTRNVLYVGGLYCLIAGIVVTILLLAYKRRKDVGR